MNGTPTGEPRLDADSIALCETPLSHVRFMDDARWPWLLLVPRAREGRPDPHELHELTRPERVALMDEIALAGEALQRATGCTSVNVGALGNAVARLHVHVVARDPGDANWPRPVWGFGTAEALQRDADGRPIDLPWADAVRRALVGRVD